MVIRRIREHVTAHNWFAVAIDLAIVVAGVFLGTQVSNWNESRLDRTQARSYHARLIEDLRVTERSTAASIIYYRDVRTHALATLRGIDRPAGELGIPFLVDAYQATQIWPRSGQRSTYNEILSAGKIELIGSPETRQRIANFYWRMDGLLSLTTVITPYRTRVRGLLPYSVQALIRADCDEILTDVGKGLMIPRLPTDCPIALPLEEVSVAIAAVRTAPGLKQDLTSAIVDLDVKLLNFAKLEASARDMRRTLTAAP